MSDMTATKSDWAVIDDAWRRHESLLPEYWRVRSLVQVGDRWEAVATDGRRISRGFGLTPGRALRGLLVDESETPTLPTP